jgi:PAS domain S-box-containing protein
MAQSMARNATQFGAADTTGIPRRALRETLAIAAAIFLITGAGIFGVWVAASSTIRRDNLDHLTDLAVVAALQVDPDLHRLITLPDQLNGPEYQRAVEPLRRMRLALPEVRYIYTLVRGEDGEVHFVLDAADPGDQDGDGVEDQSQVWEVFEDVDPTTLEALGDGQTIGRTAATPEPTTDKWGSWMTGMAPLIDGNGDQFGIVGVDVDSGRFVAQMSQTRFWAFIGLLPAALLTLLLALIYYRVRYRGLSAELAAQRNAEVLRVGQQHLASVIEHTRAGTWEAMIDPELSSRYVITVDEYWAAMVGRTVEELNPLTPDRLFPLLVHPDDAPQVREAIDQALRKDGTMFSVDVRMRHSDGHWVWAEVRGKVVERDARGHALRMLGTHMDVTVRKQAELALLKSESDFRSLFEQASGRFLKVNNALARSTGYSREELLRMTFWDISPPELHEAGKLAASKLGRNSSFGPYQTEYRRRDGSHWPVLVFGNYHVDPYGQEIGWAIVQDLSKSSQ